MRPPARVGPPGPEVFLDRSGRRRRLLRLVVIALGVGMAASLGVLGVALSGAAPGHAPEFPAVRRSPAAPTTVQSPQATAGPGAAGAPPTRSAASAAASPSSSPTATTKHGNAPTAPPGRTRPSKGPKS